MLAEEIRPPGTFLDAPAVLERQFTAYCFDRWSEQITPLSVLLEGLAFDDLDAGIDDDRGVRSLIHGEPPSLHSCSTTVAVSEAVSQQLKALLANGAPPENICVVAHAKWELDALEKSLEAVFPRISRIETAQADRGASGSVRLATIHRVKGLEFDHVILAGKLAGYGSKTVAQENRSLLYVAATRARKSLTVCFLQK